MAERLHHAILGAGGVGGLMAGSLAHFGAPVTLVVRPESVNTYPQHLRLDSPYGKFDVPVAIAAEVPPADVLWITVKAPQLEDALQSYTKP